VTHPNKPLKQYDEDDWREHYENPLHFDSLFEDYKRLKESKTELSTSEEIRMEVILHIIASKLD
jgi:hypothetical protein